MQELKCREPQSCDEILGWIQGLNPPRTPEFISWPQGYLVPTCLRRWAQRGELGARP